MCKSHTPHSGGLITVTMALPEISSFNSKLIERQYSDIVAES